MLRQPRLTFARTPARSARRRTGALILLTAAVLNLGGCYSYAATPDVPEPNERVRARLSSGGQAWLIENSGRARTNVEGTFVRADADHYHFAVWRSDLPGTTQFRTALDTLRIPSQHVTGFEARRLSAGRTILAAALAAGVVALAVGAIAGAGGGGDGDNGGGVFFNLRLNPTPYR